MKRNFIYFSDSLDGWKNLATDEWFLDHVEEEDLVLYFYCNENAVIIGKNQNPWLECDLEAMRRDSVQLVRRMSGGGAVYHDDKNLNYSFIAGEARFDRREQAELILSAVKSLGIEASFSGRNDLVVGERKFSGTAVAARKNRFLHHGTLLLDSDLARLSHYLTPDPKKIRSKGIDSVRSRVVNLKEIVPDLTVKAARNAVVRAFQEKYGFWSEWQFNGEEKKEVDALREKHASQEWRLGQTPKFDLEWEERFPWGGVRLFLEFAQGKISSAKVYTDAMDPDLAAELEAFLVGIPCDSGALQAALRSSPREEIRALADCSIL